MALSVTSELGIRSQAAEWSVLLPVLNIISFQVRPRGVLSLRTQCGSQLSKVSTRGHVGLPLSQGRQRGGLDGLICPCQQRQVDPGIQGGRRLLPLYGPGTLFLPLPAAVSPWQLQMS